MRKKQRKKPEGGKKIVARKTPRGWKVQWHPEALAEKRKIDAPERVAIDHVIEKLEVDGPALRSPHQSGVMGEEGSGLRELRPRRGRSRWRAIYRRTDRTVFAVFSVGPEAEINKAGYRRAVKAAKQRLEALENEKKKE